MKNSNKMKQYDLIVIGAGSGGLTAAIGATHFKKKVLLIEKDKIGGDCTNYGCVPSKTLINLAKTYHKTQKAKDKLKIQMSGAPSLYSVLTEVQNTINYFHSEIESVEQLKEKGLDIVFGEAKFVNSYVVEANKHQYKAKEIIIATGSHAFVPPVNGVKDINYLTNVNVFEPRDFKSLIVVGGGPIGSELGLAFAQLGVEVTLIESHTHILSREDNDAARLVEENFLKLGAKLYTNHHLNKLENTDNGVKATILHKSTNKETNLFGEQILIATGRRPNVNGLDLQAAKVKYDENGIKVNSKFQTTQRHIYAIGDVIGGMQFTHLADSHAKVALANALTLPIFKYNKIVPRVTFTTPEIASVGFLEKDLKEKGIDYLVLHEDYNKIDKAIADDNMQGFIKILVSRNGKVLGATVVGEAAGEILPQLVNIIQTNKKVTTLTNFIHPYPTISFDLAKTANTFKLKGLSGIKKLIFNLLFR